jgi:hypothetical protein
VTAAVRRTLAVLSVLELATPSALLVNLFTAHLPAVSQALGPAHGAVYLSLAAVAMMARGLLGRTRVMAIIPVVGGVLTLVNLRAERRRADGPDSDRIGCAHRS